MAMKIFKRKALFLTAWLVFAGALTVGAGAANLTAKAEGWDDLTLTMTKGASARLSEESESESGLRFKATLENYDATDAVTYGMVIVPVDYLTDITFNNDYVEKLDETYGAGNYINAQVLPTKDKDGTTDIIQHSITSIKTGNYDREFFGIAYATDGTTYKYATPNDNERSISYIASCALNDLEYAPNDLESEMKDLYEANETTLQSFVQTGVSNAGGITPAINGTNNLYTGDAPKFNVSGASNVSLEWVWSSENEEIATVSGGNVKAVKAGSTTITANCAGLYVASMEVSVSNEAGVVVPFNRADAMNYVRNSIFGNGGDGLESGATYRNDINVCEGEEYSIGNNWNTTGEKNARIELQNCLINNLNEKDADGNYLYNYISVPVYCTAATAGNEPSFSFNLQGKVKVTSDTWTVYKAVRSGDTFTFNGEDIFNRGGSSTNYGSATNLSGGGTNGEGLRLYMTTAGSTFQVFFGAIRVGYDTALEPAESLEKVIAKHTITSGTAGVAYFEATATNPATIGSVFRTYDDVPVADDKCALQVSVNQTTGNKRIAVKGDSLTVTDLNAKDDNGNYLYNSISVWLYKRNTTTTTAAAWFNLSGQNDTSVRVTLVDETWVELRADRVGDTFMLGGQDIFAARTTDGTLAACTVNNIAGLEIRFTSPEAQAQIRVSALVVGLNPNATQPSSSDS